VVIFAENMKGPFFGIGAADVAAGLDIKVGVPVGFLPGLAHDAGEQAHRRLEDRRPALIINACLLLLYCCHPFVALSGLFCFKRVRVRIDVKHLSGPLT
jgi:hypothetical protein